MINFYIIVAIVLLFFLLVEKTIAQHVIDLAGSWGFETDVMDFRRSGVEIRGDGELHDTIILPGITDQYHIGNRTTYKYYDRLTRKYEYMAPAWYRKQIQIPGSWSGKRIHLYLERAHWLTAIYSGRTEVNRNDYISVPHIHDLTGYLKPGQENIIDLMIDNRYQYNTHKWDHAHTEFTQINWNGVIGDMKLVALDPVYMDDLQLYPDVQRQQVTVCLSLVNTTGKPFTGKALLEVTGHGLEVKKEVEVASADSIISLETTLVLGKKVKLWDEFSPDLYQLQCSLLSSGSEEVKQQKQLSFGMREVKAVGDDILLNGHRLHLRGTVNNAEFPLTGHVPMDDASWEHIFNILKSYGMNHMRFHSWCPPAACFRMADKMGVYLEVEMPMWGADAKPGDEARNDFFRRELKAILKEYGNHPSFLLYCNGNELEGDFDFLNELTEYGRSHDNRRLFSGSTARKHVKAEQFYVSHRSDKGSVTIYEGRPMTDWDINAGHGTGQPIISHETGQRCVYPDFSEISAYTGPVEARNLERYRDSLAAHGMENLAADFFRVSGQQTRIEYKDVIEGQLRSSLSSGFQLLSLIDFPGQGYAPVGILNAFWKSKGIITPEKFREFCAPSVALLRFQKRAFFNDEIFSGKAELYNYSPSRFRRPDVRWHVTDSRGTTLYSGRISCKEISNYGVYPLGEFEFPLNRITSNEKLTVHLCVDKKITNSWDIWVYPRKQVKEILKSDNQVLFTTSYTAEARRYLQAGKSVVLLPRPEAVKGRKSNFHNHFWNPIMFKWQPLTLGCLIHKEQPMFADFVTDEFVDWQWWDILCHAKVIEMNTAPNALLPFIQSIDTYQHNHKLGIGFEAKLHGGKLLVLAIDTENKIDQRPASLQLLQSISNYVRSEAFRPVVDIDEAFVASFLTPQLDNEIKEAVQDEFLNSFQNK
ncbi:glycoside hydrolase family 2 TIM barrel-domain containing protein [Parabacteroides johnsonii]